jgi:hypothetical protein
MLFLKLWSILDVAVAAIVKVWSLESRVLNLLVLWRFWITGQFWIEILWRLWWCSFVVSQKHMRGSMSVAVLLPRVLRDLLHAHPIWWSRCTEGEAATATDMDPRICFCDTTNEHHHKRHRISIQNCPVIQNLHKTSKFKTLLSKDHTFTIAATATSNIDHNLRNSICFSLYC